MPDAVLLDYMIAKLSREGRREWLPLVTHAEDTCAVITRLWSDWLSEGVRSLLIDHMGDDKTALAYLKLAALLHDVGKATPDFQHKILKAASGQSSDMAKQMEERIRLASGEGLPDGFATGFPHALLSQAIALDQGLPDGFASLLGAHHGRTTEVNDLKSVAAHPMNAYGESTDAWSAMHRKLVCMACQTADFPSPDAIPVLPQPLLLLLSGLLIMADWIASNAVWFPLIPIEQERPAISSEARAAAAWARINLPAPWQSDADALEDIRLLFDEDRFGFDEPNAMQTAVLNTVMDTPNPGILILEAPMGGGKTEAALAAAEVLAAKTGRSGVFFALPTQATSNGIYPRLERWADAIAKQAGEGHTIRLVHGAAHLNPDYEKLRMFNGHADVCEDEEGDDTERQSADQRKQNKGVSVNTWFEGGKKALLADFVVGTVDQLLMAALKRKHLMLRHLGLADKVVIIDECHAYDTYMNVYLERALSWLGVYRVPVIILSATLPAERRAHLLRAYLGKSVTIPQEVQNTLTYPLLTYSSGKDVRTRELPREGINRTVTLCPIKADELTGTVQSLMEDGGCMGIIVNTVERAQTVASNLKKLYPNEDIRLLHSRFVMADRIKKEKALQIAVGKHHAGGNRPERCIIVGTQVMEQSLDIDFDVLLTDLCPIDLLLQRLGRLHRHPLTPRPAARREAVCYVIGADEDNTEEGQILYKACTAVYSEYLLLMTRKALPEQVCIPKDIPRLIREVYEGDGAFPEESEAYQTKNKEQKNKAKAFLLPQSNMKLSAMIPATLNGILYASQNSADEYDAEAAVRDTVASLEVIALWKDADGQLRTLGNDRIIPLDRTLPTFRMMAGERLRLPAKLCKWYGHGHEHEVDMNLIHALEDITAREVPWWQESSLLCGELLLLFDENRTAPCREYIVTYDPFLGMYSQKRKDETE